MTMAITAGAYVYGSQFADVFMMNYSTNGYDVWVYDLAYAKNGELVLTVNDLDLYTTTSDLEAGAWAIRVNAGNDTLLWQQL